MSVNSVSRTKKVGRKKIHGMDGTKIYYVWSSMKKRCLNVNHKAYHRYGGRGITVCDRWIGSFESFYADMGDKPDGYQLDRIDNNKGYHKDNCRWVPPKLNARNRSDNKLDEDTVSYIKTILKYKLLKQRELARILNISEVFVSDIKKGKAWVDIQPLPI